SGGGDQVVKLWNVQARNELRSLRGHADWISSVAFSKDGLLLVSASVDRTVKLFELQKEEGAAALGHTRKIRAVTVSADGKWLATGGADRLVKVWNLATGTEKWTFLGHTDEIQSLAISPDGKWLVSGALDGHMKVWDLETGKEIKSIGPVGRVPGLIFLPDSKRFVAWFLQPKSESDSASTFQSYEAPNWNVVETFSDGGRAVTCGA